MEINWLVLATIAAPIVALFIGAALDRFIERKPKVFYYLGHMSNFRLRDQKKTNVYTHSIVIMNSGKKTAKGVRIGHNVLPQDFNISPSKEYEVVPLPDNGKEIKFATIVPGEVVAISYLYFSPLQWNQINTDIKHDDGFGKEIQVLPTKQFPKWQLMIFGAFLMLGIISFIYLLYEFLSRFIKVVFLAG